MILAQIRTPCTCGQDTFLISAPIALYGVQNRQFHCSSLKETFEDYENVTTLKHLHNCMLYIVCMNKVQQMCKKKKKKKKKMCH